MHAFGPVGICVINGRGGKDSYASLFLSFTCRGKTTGKYLKERQMISNSAIEFLVKNTGGYGIGVAWHWRDKGQHWP